MPAPYCSNPGTNYLAPVQKLQAIPAVPEGGVLQVRARRDDARGYRAAGAADRRLQRRLSADQLGARRDADESAQVGRARAADPAHRQRAEAAPIRAEADRPQATPRRQAPRLTFPLPTSPAVYSVEVTIQNHRGRLLGRYGEYVRVVERKVEVGVSLPTYDNVLPGSTLEACFENKGTATMTPGATTLERLDGTTWKPVNMPTTYSLATRTLGPGESEKLGVAIPPRASGGLYKLTVTGATDLGEPVTVTAEFGVL